MPSKTLKSHQNDRLLGMSRRARSSVTTHTCLETQICKMLSFPHLVNYYVLILTSKIRVLSRENPVTKIKFRII